MQTTDEFRERMAKAREARIARPREKTPSLRAAINAHCKSCIYHESNGGTWRQQVEACTVTRCELYPVRPRSKGLQVPE